jgi:enoyl-CoA hydratase/carnithine racemase
MNDSNAVRYEVDDQIAWVTLARPERRNALSRAMREGLFDAVRRFNADDSARVLVLAADGRVFCAGGDLKEMATEGLTVPPLEWIPQFGRNIEISKPTIAAVQGPALAGGFLLVQNCDLVVASTNATFGITEAKVGRGAPWAAPLPWLIPPRVAMQMLVTGDPLDAGRAHELGLVNEVVEPADLYGRVRELALRIAGNAPLSVAAAKRTVRLIAEHPLSKAFDRAEEIWRPVYLSADAQEGPAAFRDRRSPKWQGR